MKLIHAKDHPRLVLMRDLLIEISRASDPREVMAAIADRFWKLRSIEQLVSVSQRGLGDGQYKITRRMRRVHDEHGGHAESIGPADPWKQWDSLPTHQGGFMGAMMAGGEPTLVHDADLRADPVLGDSVAGLGSVMCVPLYDRGLPANWVFSFHRDPRGYTIEDLEQTILSSNLIGGTNKQLLLIQEIERLNAALRAQFEEVARVQRSLLPAVLPKIPGLDLATSYLTSEQAGGDYYDFFELPGGRWGFLIADVSGHGAAAATVMAMLHAIIHGYEGSEHMPEAVLRYTNSRLIAAGVEGTFVTAFLAAYEPASGRLRIARAGHNPPRLLRAGVVGELCSTGGLPLGVFSPYEIEGESIQLQRGDTVILYTDGITESFSPDKRMLGVEGLDAAIATTDGTPDRVVDAVHAAVFALTGKRSRRDDQTLLVLRYTPGLHAWAGVNR